MIPPSNPAIHLVNPLEVSDWDAQVALLPGAGFFHTAAWARVLHGTYGYQPDYLTHYAPSPSPLSSLRSQVSSLRFPPSPPLSLLPLMEVDSWLTGRRGVSLPFTDAVEPLCPDSGSFNQLLSAARELAGARGWKYLECRGGKKWLPEAPASTSFLNHRLPLSAGESALFAGFDDSVRRALRKAEHSGLTVEFSQSLASLQTFYHLLGLTRQRHGVPPQPFPFFAHIHEHILAKNLGWVVLAHQGTVPVAGAVFFHFGRTAIYKFGASDEAFQHLRANNLVMWHAIRRLSTEGFTQLDFGRTSLGNEGLRKFKLGWGTQEEQVDYIRYDLKSANYVTARDEATGWHNRVFRVLPRPLSRLAGALLYRHLG